MGEPARIAPHPIAATLIQEVIVRDLRVAANIGVHAHEVGRRQALRLDVRLVVRPVLVDRLADTIDYATIVAHASALAAEHIALIETFGRRLALACLDRPAVVEADITVEKPGALLEGLASARVVLRAGGSRLT